MPADPKQVESLFNRALALPVADRAAFLAAECPDDAELRQRVERLLAAHEELGESDPAATATFGSRSVTSDHQPRQDAGTVIAGKYKLIEEIGEGGMGNVWMAQQTEPVKRLVAVKLIKAGMDSKAVLARFEAERQALALMDHPNIARVFDAGATPDGRPFFVMELVKGIPITKFCDDRKLTPKERLELFVPVCNAIQHAHQKGVIHRDIKPTNVLVALYDDRPVPKVIDFGVAKATGQPLTDKTLATGFGAIVGTPEYMSPEQASFNNLDIDTRSDVYALGVLLYELLTGGPPFRRKELERVGLMEIFRVIREQEPPRPSTRLSSAETLPTLAANRSTEPAKLTRLLRSELDWVVMKALEKDRNRRYETANSFAADVQRYLVGEAVQAVPPSAGYRLRKFLRKNRVAVGAVSAVLLALVVGIAGMTAGLVYAVRARQVAETAETNERAERGKAEAARTEADELRRKAEWQAASATIDFLKSIGDEQSLLRLARMACTLPPHAENLRQYLMVRLITDLQDRCPLAPTLEGTRLQDDDVWGEIDATPTPDGRFLVGRTTDEGASVWEAKTHRRLVRLRDGNDSPKHWPYQMPSAPGLAWTWAENGGVCVWELASGRLLLQTTPGFWGWMERFGGGPVWLSPRHLLVQSGAWRENRREPGFDRYELWDIAGQRRVATWIETADIAYKSQVGDDNGPPPERYFDSVQFSPDGTTFMLRHTDFARVRRIADGQLVKVLPNTNDVTALGYSPSGRRAITLADGKVQWWRTDTWEPDGPATPSGNNDELWRFLTDDVAVLWHPEYDGRDNRPGALVNWGNPVPLTIPGPHGVWASAGGRLFGDRWVLDAATRQLNHTPPDHPYHPDAVHAAAAGRWLLLGSRLVDLAVGKELGTFDEFESAPVRMPAGGYLCRGGRADVVYIPPPTLNISPEVLELWVELILRCDLGPGDEVRRWDEATWEQKRQEFAARVKPTPDFPFPGRIATDRMYWLRTEIEDTYWDHRADRDTLNMPRLVELFDRLLAVEPSPRGHLDRGKLRAELGRWHGAADDFLTHNRLDPTYSWKADFTSLSWQWAMIAGEPAERYQAAIRLAEVARKEEPEDWKNARTLGVAHYRLGRHREAIRFLREAHDRYHIDEQVQYVLGPRLLSPLAAAVGSLAEPPGRGDPATFAALAMAHHRLGEAGDARARLAELREFVAKQKVPHTGEAERWLKEAAEVVEGKR